MAEFEAAFPYEETPDQLAAIESVKHDMAQGKPMDRLICGDVGYGKTEVADPGGLQGRRRRQAGRRARPHHDPRRAAPSQLLGTHGRVSLRDRGRQPLPAQARDPRSPQAHGRGRRRHPDRHPPNPPKRRRVQGPRPGDHRRGTAVRRRGQGVAQDASDDGRRPDPLGHADSPHPAHEPAGNPRYLQPRDPSAGSQGDRDPGHPVRPRDRQARHPPRAQPRRPDLFRPQPRLRHHHRSPT